ncbi:MAG TPA: endonuclease/exonuclease/phosphatase family protein [Candidatus Binataceae bacterium]|nr:endonuclease/exonuclease/phosphatase family protein [Candidatus Binataceae bacterium]
MSRDTEGRLGPSVTVMTQNLYFGAELAPIFIARSQEEMVAAAAVAWEQVQASEIAERAEKIAELIAAEAPDLVALQEAAQWSAGKASAMTVKYDFLSSILQALQSFGVFYVPVAISRNLDRMAPIDTEGRQVRITDRDAVLLKIGESAIQVRPFNIQLENFAALMPVTSPVMGAMMVPRGWIAIDAAIDERKFRFINTHLESYDAQVQIAQAAELIAGPCDTKLPLIIVGDFNSNANQKTDDAPANENARAYGNLIASGLTDAWASMNPGDPGNTCCQPADLMNDAAALSERIDLILMRGRVTPISAKLVANQPRSRTKTGRWASDHAGVLARVRIE